MTDEEAVVERAARLILRCRDSDGAYEGTAAAEVLDEHAGDDLDLWFQLARKARRRVREIRGEGLPEGRRTESTIEPVHSPGSARSRPRDTY